MNFKTAFACTLGYLIAKDVYEFVTDVGCMVIYSRYSDKLDAIREKWNREIHRKTVDEETIIGFKA